MSAYSDTLCRVTSLSRPRYWSVVGQFIDNETKRRGWSDLHFATNASLSRATIARLKAGEALGEASLAKIEGALDLPRDLLIYIAAGDLAEIDDATRQRDPDLVRWLRKKFADFDRERVEETQAMQRIVAATATEPGMPMAARRGRQNRPEPHAE